MKISIVTIIFSCCLLKVNAQSQLAIREKTPFDVRNLEEFSHLMKPDDTLKPQYVNGVFVYLNNHNIQAINGHYQEAYPFFREFAVVKANGRYGVISKKGVVVVKPTFESFNIYNFPFGIMFRPESFFDFGTGKLDTVKGFRGERHPYFPPDYTYKDKDSKKYGVRFKEGSKGIKPIYDSIMFCSELYIIAKKSGRYGIIDTTGKIILPFRYENYRGNSYYFALKQGTEWYYYEKLKKMFSSKYEPVYLNKNKNIFKIGHLLNYFDDTGRVVLKRNYKWISTKGCLAINENNEIVFLNSKGEGFVYFKLKEFK